MNGDARLLPLGVVTAALALSAATSSAYQSASPSTDQAAAPPAFSRVCGKCHALDRTVQGRRSRAQWDEVIEGMIAEGATATDEEFEAIAAYLVAEFGRVSVNSAPVDELAAVLHLPLAEAERIVAYRKANGPFGDFAALVAMPDAPVEHLRQRRDAMVF